MHEAPQNESVSPTTVGLELEWADVDRHAEIPEQYGKWSCEDYSIVNSDGHANCPTGTNWRWGGEINTRPTRYAWEQGRIVRELRDYLRPTVNWKCNLHVHVRHDEFDVITRDVELLKRLARWMRDQEEFVYSQVSRIRVPVTHDFEPGGWQYNEEVSLEYSVNEQVKGAMKRYRRNLGSHQHRLSDERFAEMMLATTPEEFKNAHASPTTSGGRAWHIAKRPGMNMRSLWKHGTIEFRHFFGTDNLVVAESSARWCQAFVEAAVEWATTGNAPSAMAIFEQGRFDVRDFPREMPFNLKQAIRFDATKHGS